MSTGEIDRNRHVKNSSPKAVKQEPIPLFHTYGYLFELDRYEKDEVVKNFDRLNSLKFSTVTPTAFTERGLYMLATILKGERAENTTLAIVDTFVQIRELARTMEALQNVEDGGAQQRTLLQRTGDLLAEVVGHNLSTMTTETEIELNFAVVKIKHKVVRKGIDKADGKEG